MDVKKYTYWRGQYRHVAYEIVNRQIGGRDVWTAYIMTNSNQIKLTYESRIIGTDMLIQSFNNESILRKLSDSIHGGITLYEVTTSPGMDVEHYRVGWDYAHLWDEGIHYDETSIYDDVVKAIDALWIIAPDMKVWCSTVGGWHNLADDVAMASIVTPITLEWQDTPASDAASEWKAHGFATEDEYVFMQSLGTRDQEVIALEAEVKRLQAELDEANQRAESAQDYAKQVQAGNREIDEMCVNLARELDMAHPDLQAANKILSEFSHQLKVANQRATKAEADLKAKIKENNMLKAEHTRICGERDAATDELA